MTMCGPGRNPKSAGQRTVIHWENQPKKKNMNASLLMELA